MVEAVPVVEVAACLHLQRHAVGELPGVLHVAREEGTPHVLASDEFLIIPRLGKCAQLRWRAVKAAPSAAGSEVHCAVLPDGDCAGFAEEVRARARSNSVAYFEDGDLPTGADSTRARLYCGVVGEAELREVRRRLPRHLRASGRETKPRHASKAFHETET